MKFFFMLIAICVSITVCGQSRDSINVNFRDSNAYPQVNHYSWKVSFQADTSATPIWQIGETHKIFISHDTSSYHALMTDTLNPYLINANNWFTLKLDPAPLNPIIGFWHKYQTTRGKDGCIVEFSTDSGTNWLNVVGGCTGFFPYIETHGFYFINDTLENGTAAFSGRSNHEIYSEIDILDFMALKSTSIPGCSFENARSFYFRFRFVSDSIPELFAGWMIDSIKVVERNFGGLVKNIDKHSLTVSPNPSYSGNFIFPVLENEEQNKIEIYTILGEQVISMPYSHSIDLRNYAKGMYYYKVSNGMDYYTGKLVYE